MELNTDSLWENSGGYRSFVAKFRRQQTIYAGFIFLEVFGDVSYVSGPNPKTMPFFQSLKRKKTHNSMVRE